MINLLSIPGFGGARAAAPPPPPPPLPAPAKKTDVAVQKARAAQIKQSKLAAGLGGTNITGGVLTDDASVTNPTLV
jgi:hypothetical protein